MPDLYLVATPIGNLSELTPRALEILKKVDLIACEDTRNSLKLLSHFGISQRLFAYHDFNEEKASGEILAFLAEGKDVALISDAGYPLISDPGYRLVNKAVDAGFRVIPVSGANACLDGLIASGLPPAHFLFYGFLNANPSKARKELESLRSFPYTVVFYEAPHRIHKTLNLLYEVFGNRKVCIARELTKLHEEFIRGELQDLQSLGELKGEIVLIVEGQTHQEKIDPFSVLDEVEESLKTGMRTKEAVSVIAKKYGLSKNELYDLYLKNRREE